MQSFEIDSKKLRKLSGIAYVGVVLVVVVVAVAVFFLLPRDSGKSGLPPWKRLGNLIGRRVADSDDPCGNDIGNGAEMISGAEAGVRDDIDHDNPFRSLTVHPDNSDIVYVGTERNGILRSKNGGGTWERLRYGIRHSEWGYPEVYDMAISRSNPDVIYAAITEGPGPVIGRAPSSNGGVYKSVDGGDTWERKNCGLTSGAVLSVWVDPEDEDYALIGLDAGEITYDFPGVEKGFYPGGVYQTYDGGKNWEKATNLEGTENNSYIQIKGSENAVYTLGTYGRDNRDRDKNIGVLKSGDKGRNWMVAGERYRSRMAGYFAISSDGRVVYVSKNDYGVIVSEDGGESWSELNLNNYIYTPAVDPQDSKRVFFGIGNDLYVTNDGFRTSNRLTSRTSRETVHFSDIVFAPSDPAIIYAIAVGYDLYKSTDSGETFAKIINLREDVLEKVH